LTAGLVGLELERASRDAAAAGWEVTVVYSSPPWPGRGEGRVRVIRTRRVGPAALELTAAWEGWAPAGREKP